MHAKYLLPTLPRIDYVIVYAGLNDMGLWLHRKEFDPDYLRDSDNWSNRVGEAFRWSAYTPADWPIYKRAALWKLASRLKDIYFSKQSRAADRAFIQDAELKWLEEARRQRRELQSRL